MGSLVRIYHENGSFISIGKIIGQGGKQMIKSQKWLGDGKLQVITRTDKLDRNIYTGVGLGNFDGLHIGHMALIGTLISECRLNGLASVVYTFRKHPENILRKNLVNPLITSNDQKIRVLEAQDIDWLYYQDFDEEFSHLSPEDFIKNILVDGLNMRLAVVGFNYRFGYMGKGDPELLKRLGDKYGFRVIVVPPVRVNSEIVSSTLIRQYIKKGKMERVFQLLGRHFSLKGMVVDGRRIGRTLGFLQPTSSLIRRWWYRPMVFISPRPSPITGG